MLKFQILFTINQKCTLCSAYFLNCPSSFLNNKLTRLNFFTKIPLVPLLNPLILLLIALPSSRIPLLPSQILTFMLPTLRYSTLVSSLAPLPNLGQSFNRIRDTIKLSHLTSQSYNLPYHAPDPSTQTLKIIALPSSNPTVNTNNAFYLHFALPLVNLVLHASLHVSLLHT